VRARSLVVVLVLLLAGSLGSAPRVTLAAWTDSEVSTAALQAATLTSPLIDSCAANGVLGLGATATLRWHFPTGFGYTVPTNAQFYLATNGLLSSLLPLSSGTSTPTTPDVNGVYTTTFSTGLLGSLLGADAMIGVATVLSNWTSPVSTRVVHWGLLSNSCV
jgi:predicted ribosomally synthesized peptide with SipW-like signal peptide